MMVNSYYGIYQAERGKTAAELRAADAQIGEVAAQLGELGSALAAPVRTVRRSLLRRRSVAAGPPRVFPRRIRAPW
jgi:hypothetical protein